MSYASDLSDEEWSLLLPILESSYKRTDNMERRKHSLRCIMNAMFYICKTGCAWRDLPSDFPPYLAVLKYKIRLEKLGIFDKIHEDFLK